MIRVYREEISAKYQQETNCPFVKIRLPDKSYILPTVREVRDWMDNFAVQPYVPESNDCDNRALLLTAHFSGKGWAFGWASIGLHDICTFLSEKKEIWFVEPSNCIIYPPDVNLTWLVMP